MIQELASMFIVIPAGIFLLVGAVVLSIEMLKYTQRKPKATKK